MPTWEELKAQGNAHFGAGQNEDALTSYQAAIDAAVAADSGASTQLHVLHSNAAAAALRLGRAAEALQHAERSVELKPEWVKGWARKAAACTALHRPGHAEAALRQGLKHVPGDPALERELKQILEASAASLAGQMLRAKCIGMPNTPRCATGYLGAARLQTRAV